jgi:gliding motility-associated-like protein
MSKNSYSKLLIFLLLMLSSLGAIFALSPFRNNDDQLSQLSQRLEALSQVSLDTIPGAGNARVLADIIIPIIQGFPYCETFTESSTRANTVFGGTGIATNGVQWKPFLTSGSPDPSGDGFLRLTQNEQDQNGFVYVDIPFPSKFGLKLSFEYFSYGSTEDIRADGFSFFMFDGALGQISPNFEIGGVGGALGYAPLQTTSGISEPGLKGAYLGIGFDELGNFGNISNGKYGAFFSASDPPYSKGSAGKVSENNNRHYPHSVVIRGPVGGLEDITTPFFERDRLNDFIGGSTSERYKSYQFIDGKILNFSKNDSNPPIIAPSLLSPNVFVELDDRFFLNSKYDRFTIDANSLTRPENCDDSGYRKVFIDLRPEEIDPVSNRPTKFSIQVFMLVNIVGAGPELIQVFDSPVSYNFPSPELLKVGFAAATGNNVNFHDIRNVTVQVSDENSLDKPEIKPLSRETCEGGINSFTFPPITLVNDENNGFIRCIQLYESEPDAVLIQNDASIPFPPDANIDLCDGGDCFDYLCREERLQILDAKDANGESAGKFTLVLELEGGLEVPKVKFEGNPNYSGTVTVYYTATDNFGQVSDPKEITITINPNPEPLIDTLDPRVWEQSKINDISVLWDSGVTGTGYTYRWFRDGTLIPLAYQPTYLATQQGDYTVEVTTDQGCVGSSASAVTIRLAPDLNPVWTKTRETCVELGTIQVNLDYAPVSAGSSDGEKWRIVDDAGNVVVNWRNLAVGQSVINYPEPTDLLGLPAGAYVFQIGDNFRDELSDPPRFRHERDFTIDPIANPLEITSVVEVPELCFGQGGTITVNGAGGDGPASYVYTAINTNTSISYPYLATSGSGTAQAVFNNLPQGNYTIGLKSGRSGSRSICEVDIIDDVVITQPAQLAVPTVVPENPTCGDSNGSVKFEITGGVTPYTLVMNNLPISAYSTSLTAGVYEVKNLAPGEYSLAITDVNDCPLNLPNLFTLTNETGFNVEVNPMKDVVCVGQDLVFSPVFIPMLSVTPVLSWYKDAALNQPITSSPTPDSEGITYQIDPADGRLTISDQSAGNFNYYLEISGPGICTFVEVADAEVFAAIEADITVDNITCFGNTDGVITIVPRGGNGVFEVSFDSSPFTTDLTYSNLAPGSYTVEIRNDIGCPFAETVLVEGPTAPISINSPTIERASCDLANGSIRDLVITGGWGNYTVEWRAGSITGSVISGTVSEALDLLPNTYYLIVSDTEGCLSIFDFLVEESSDPVYAIVPPVNSCVGSPVVIRPLHIAPDLSLPPAAATEVRWYTDPGQIGLIQNGADPVLSSVNYTIDDTDWLHPELVITGLPAGTYDFYFYVVCTGQEIKIDIIVYDTPAITLEPKAIVCFGDTNGKVKVLSGDNPTYSYSVNDEAPINQTAFEALNLAAGTYSLAIATPAGCAQSTSFTIDGPSALLDHSPLTKVDPGCGAPNGQLNLTVTGGWLPYTLAIIKDGVSQGLQTINQSNISLGGYRPGVYQIRITDKEGCLVITNTVTLVDGPTQLLVDSDEICVGSIASLMPELNPIAAGASFQWFLDATTTESIISSPSPAGDGRIYQINTATGELTIGNLPASVTEYSYYVTASGAGVCPGFTGNGKVRVYSNPTATVVNEVCFGAGGSIVINTTGDSGSYTYSLNGGAFGSTNVFQVATGTHNVQVRTSAGCLVNIANIPVAGPGAALSTSDLSKDNASCGLDNGEVRFTISGGYVPYTITYTKNGSNAGSADLITAGEVRISNLGIGIYEFKVLDAQGCSITVPNTVTITEVPTVLTANDDAICHGEVAQSTPSVPQNIVKPQFFWSFDPQGTSPISTGTLDGVTYSINSLGALSVEGLSPRGAAYTYYVKVSGVGICGLEAKPVSIKVYKVPLLRVSNPSIICDPTGTVDLTDFIEGFNPNIYDYRIVSPSDNAMRLDELASVAVSGDYRVSSSLKGTGCFNQAQRIRVLIADTALVADFQYEADLGGGILLPNAEIQIQENVNFLDLSQGNVLIWDWDFGDGNSSSSQNPVHQYQEKGVYTVMLTAIDSIGCISTYQVVVEVLNDYAIMIPNAFTPTGTKNLTFRPYYRGIASMEFYIFSTWGELIYEAKSMEDQGWDGTLNGENVPNGNYVFKGRFVSKSGEMIDKSGVFILIR